MNTARIGLSLSVLLLVTTSSAVGSDDPPAKQKPYEIKVEKVKAQPAMTIRFRTTPDKISANYGRAFSAIVGYIASKGVQPAGAPFGRYHEMTRGQLDIEAGIPVAKALEGKGEIKASPLPAGIVATTIHRGPYEKLSAAHEALQKWAGKNHRKVTGAPWECYLTDPGQEPDQSKWETKVYLPIAPEDKSKSK